MIKNNKGERIKIVLPSEILDDILKNVGNSVVIKIILCVYEHGIISLFKLCEILEIENGRVVRCSENLVFKKYVRVFTTADRNEKHYGVNIDIIEKNVPCEGCEFHSTALTEFPAGKYKTYKCNAEFSCLYEYYRYIYNIYKVMVNIQSLVTTGIEKVHRKNSKVRYLPKDDIETWNKSDFMKYVKYLYSKYTPQYQPQTIFIYSKLTSIIAFFKHKENNWKFHVKNYLKINFKGRGGNSDFNGLRCLAYDQNLNLYDSELYKKINKCDVYGIYCVHWQGRCKFKSECTDTLRDNVREQYN